MTSLERFVTSLHKTADEISGMSHRTDARVGELECAATHVRMAVEHLQKALAPAPPPLPSREDYEITRHERGEAIAQREAMRERALELRTQLDKHHADTVAPGSWCAICGAKEPLMKGYL